MNKKRYESILIMFLSVLSIFTGCSGQSESLLQKLGLAALIDRTVWTVETGEDGEKGFFVNGSPIILKGVCYSPTQINDSNKNFPNIGDWFWDTFTSGPATIYNWYGMWGDGALGGTGYYAREDLNKIRDLNANAIRVYSMMSRQPNENGTYPPPRTGTHYTHKLFLDKCYNGGNKPLYVMVGIPMPDCSFKKHVTSTGGMLEFYEAVLDETTKDLADDPAVLGFVLMNELDQAGASHYLDGTTTDEYTDYFYSQAVKYATLVKTNAPHKLVGWAIHDSPPLVKYANTNYPTAAAPDNLDKTRTYLENLAGRFDYWGVNTYQPTVDGLKTLLGPTTIAPDGIPYGVLSASVRKPVILLEYGWPATGHDGDGKLYTDNTTQTNVANYITANFAAAFGYAITEGIFYFEFADEWWKQTETGHTYQWDATTTAMTIDYWPNGYGDEEGFGLYGLARSGSRTNNESNWDTDNNGPVLPLDTLVERTPITAALKTVFGSH